MIKHVTILGSGIIGMTLAYSLRQRFPELGIHIYDKEPTYGLHQSSRNSGVLHAGLHYEPGSLKAKLSTRGIRLMTQFAQEHKIRFEQCGKIIVARDEKEIEGLHALYEKGKKNGLKGLTLLSKKELLRDEPNINGLRGLLVPEEGIIDYSEVMKQLYSMLSKLKVQFSFGHSAASLSDKITSSNSLMVNCTGLFADLVFSFFTGQASPIRIVPFRGDYYSINRKNLIRHLVYPVPDPIFPFLGIHLTRALDGSIEAGPNASLAFKREGYKFFHFSLTESLHTFQWKGFWKFLWKYKYASMKELRTSLSKSAFLSEIQRFIPDINKNELSIGTSGVRAQAMNKDGTLEMDFVIKRHENQIHVLNAPSPGATASFAIADYIIDEYIMGLV